HSENPDYINSIRDRLIHELDDPEDYPAIRHRRIPRQMKLFAAPTTVNLSNEPNTQQTVMEVSSPDRPGLLARNGKIYTEH
ncbi:hypothetical protein Q4498_18265, partial [Neptunomonas phycophila]|uniref:hypothetical protein n=1 Tax=Neptunomonas phycophila TaxID=1572645 RepID=UPI0026E3ABE9